MNKIIESDLKNLCKETLPWEKLEGKKVLITGATGFLGSWITKVLLYRNQYFGSNITIFALCRNIEKARNVFSDFQSEKIVFVIQDVCEDISDSYKSDIIIHAASPANPYIIDKEPYSVIQTNVFAYAKLLRYAKKWGGVHRIVLFSSSAVYGYESPSTGADEMFRDRIDFTCVKDVYCLSKQMCEMMSVCYQKEHNICIQRIRPFVVFGPGDNFNNKKAWIDFANHTLNDEDIVIKSDGSAVRSYVYVADAIRAFYYILLLGTDGEYNIANCENELSISELARSFSNYNCRIKIKYELDNSEYLKNKTNYMTGTMDKLVKLGWRPQISVSEGIGRTLEWAQENRNGKE